MPKYLEKRYFTLTRFIENESLNVSKIKNIGGNLKYSMHELRYYRYSTIKNFFFSNLEPVIYTYISYLQSYLNLIFGALIFM